MIEKIEIKTKNALSLFSWPISFIATFFMAMGLVVIGAANLSYYLLLLISLLSLVFRLRPGEQSFSEFLYECRFLHLSMAGMLVAILINHSISGGWTIKTYDYPSRMATFFLVLWAFLQARGKLLRIIQWGYVGGAFLSAIKMYVMTQGGTVRTTFALMPLPLIPFSEFAVLLGFFAVLSIYGSDRKNRFLLILKILAGVAGIYASVLSMTRGAWIVIPVLALIVVMVVIEKIPSFRKMLISGVIIALCTFAFLSTDIVRQRIAQASSDITQYEAGQQDTSVGVRFQLWRASWQMFLTHPIAGVGRENFSSNLAHLPSHQLLSEAAVSQPHAHNEALYNLATLGVIGLLALLAMYFVPLLYFLRDLRSRDKEIRVSAGIGVMLCVGFIIFGLTDVVFIWGVCADFYTIVMAVCFANIIQKKRSILTAR